CQQHNGHPLTF
nr:immunoglobulin light chain junction region [Macaca mulatta]MOW52491.1 immunoglobulin light chain junction region [Macaca mulatta]MOW52647.1 immunoglobulin light chain junction region [Macaca mulatta]MOW53031.1 immunoglobulin light chain junction region [Macaca mulatta]MOW54111.1 immunoglobulin light chain junction region [Macaca mulatta]